MSTYLEIQWLGLDAAQSAGVSTSDPATGALQQEQLAVLNEIYATALLDSEGAYQTYALSTTYTKKYIALVAGAGYSNADSIERISVYSYSDATFSTAWNNTTTKMLISQPPIGDLNEETANLITSHTDERSITLGASMSTQQRTYTFDLGCVNTN